MQHKLIAGVDEVGRGPLAGPVVSAAVILPEAYDLPGLCDSKKLSEKSRERLFDMIHTQAIAVGIGHATPAEIDKINILQATLLSMKRAIESLAETPTYLYVDGLHLPKVAIPGEGVVKGDSLVPAISAASIIAKVTRDREMLSYASEFPGYGFEQHKGYPTKAHREALATLGPSPIHRRTFAPVRDYV